MTCGNHGRCRSESSRKQEPVPVKRYVHPICCAPASSSRCQALEEILMALERQNSLLEALCRTLGGRDGGNL